MQQLPKDKAALNDLLDELIAKRLLEKVRQEMEPQSLNQAPAEPGEIVPLSQEEAVEFTPAEFAKVEKNLVSLGFFTPSSKRIKDAKAKIVSINAVVNGYRIEAKATIAPAALYGLPITADQDKYLALQKLITDLRQRQGGQIANPISFTSAELLHLLQQGDAGKNYREIDEWLNVMSSTTIISEGAVYLAGKKRWVKDRFHVFDRAVSFGKEIEPGVIADRNYIWFSDWQLQNINNNYLIPVDLETYRQLKNHIAKTLVPLLQVWLFASRVDGCFEKRYDELCQILSIRQYQYLSRVKEQLGPSLNELQQHGYLASWNAEPTHDDTGYKLVFHHGEKFRRDRRKRLAARDRSQSSLAGSPHEQIEPSGDSKTIILRKPRQTHLHLQAEVDAGVLTELTNRGVGESGARKLLTKLPADRPVLDLLEWGDSEIARQPGKIQNPAGFYIRLLEEHSAPPPSFETTRQRKALQEAEFAQQRALQEAEAARDRAQAEDKAKAERRLAALNPEQHSALEKKVLTRMNTEVRWLAEYGKSSTIYQDMLRNYMLRELMQPMDLLVVPQPLGASATETAIANSAIELDAHPPRDSSTGE